MRRGSSSTFTENRGPESVEELLAWDSQYAAIGKSTGLGARALQLLENAGAGTIWTSDYSGTSFDREAWRVLLPTLAGHLEMPAPKLQFLRSCDWGPLQQRVLSRISLGYDAGASCVFQDLNDRLHPDAKAWLESIAPTKKTTLPAAKAANVELKRFLETCSTWVFDQKATSECVVHKQKCPAYPLAAYTKLWALRDASCEQPPIKKIKGGTQPQAWWERLAFESNTEDEPDKPLPLSISFAGLTCTDYSALGKQARQAGIEERHAAVHLQERRFVAKENLEDMFMTECSERYPAEQKQVAALHDSHTVIVIRTGPLQQGFPVRRGRLFTAGLSKAKLVWVGPDSLEDCQASFNALFQRTTELTGDVFFHAAEQDISDFAMQRSQRRRRILPAGFRLQPMDEYLHLLVPKGCLLRKADYDGLREERSSLDGAFFADLDQNPDQGCQPGFTIPSLNTHPDMYSYNARRLAVIPEYFGMQGVDCSPTFCSAKRGPSPMMAFYHGLDEGDIKTLVGNGIFVPVLAAFYLFILGNTIKREVPHLRHLRTLQVLVGVADQEGEQDELWDKLLDKLVQHGWRHSPQ